MRRLRLFLTCLMLAGLPLAAAAEPHARPRLGLVLSGGGARGLAHIGVLKVMEEAGLRPDCIVGTSMGAILGGLYSLGYDAQSLKTIVLGQDWPSLTQDRVARKHLTWEDKQELGKYLVSFPISGGQVRLPSGLVSGQNITTLLTRLAFAGRFVDDFHQLPIPFECLATDIATGKPVVLDHGYLAEAMRASMAIPSIFTPVALANRVLLDGGLVRDLPVSNALAMGAEHVIAVDVNSQLCQAEKLDSLYRILDQTLLIYTLNANRAQAEQCHVLLQPEVVEYGLLTFEQAAAIIQRGEDEARRHWDELTALARQLGARPAPAFPNHDFTSVKLAGIEIEGLVKIPRDYVLRRLNLSLPAVLRAGELEQAINRLYGTRYFQSVRYRFKPGPEGETLVVSVVEQSGDALRFGIHYDNELNAMLMLSADFRNHLIQGSELRADACLSKLSDARLVYFQQAGPFSGVGLQAEFGYQGGPMSLVDAGGAMVQANRNCWRMALAAQGALFDELVMGAGLEKEMLVSSHTLVRDEPGAYTETFNYYGYLRVDTLDQSFYPRRGWMLNTETRWITSSLALGEQTDFSPFAQVWLKALHTEPLFSFLAVSLGLQAGVTLAGDTTPGQWFYLGGMTGFQRHQIPFLGMPAIQVGGPQVCSASFGLQLEPWSDRFLILRASTARVADRWQDLITGRDWLQGYGLTAGVLTLIGPVDVTVMFNSRGEASGFVNIGYPF